MRFLFEAVSFMDRIINQRLFFKFLQTMRVQLLTVLILIVLAILAFTSIRNYVLNFSNQSGSNLAASYAAQVDINIKQHANLLDQYAEEFSALLSNTNQHSSEEITQYLRLFSHLNKKNLIFPYIYYNKKIYGRDKIYTHKEFNINQREWYQKAMLADGKTIVSSLYSDMTEKIPVITIAKKLSSLDAVIAIDIFPNYFEPIINNPLPYGSRYYLTDKTGKIIFSTCGESSFPAGTQECIYTIIEQIQKYQITENNPFSKSPLAEGRAIYFAMTDEGWYSIISVQHDEFMAGVTNIFIIIWVSLAIFLIYSLYALIREYYHFIEFEKITKSINVLSNRYISIYKINCNANTYEALKFSEKAEKYLEKNGNYTDFLNNMHHFIEENAVADFKQCFSSENIQRLIDNRIFDYGGDFKRIFSDGLKWVSVRCLIDPNTTTNEALLCFVNIDQQKMLELKNTELLENALNYAKHSQEAKNHFFSSISHDMRTPLNAIIGLTELAENYTDDINEIKKYIHNINISGTQLLNLVNDILNLSQIEQNKIAINAKEFNLKNCIQDCYTVFKIRADKEKKKLSIHWDITDETVRSDDFRISQILNNLLSNALKYTNENNEISITVKQLNINSDNEMVQYQFIVADNGIGMSEDFVKRIFVPYSRETRFSSTKIEGTGLGMCIVQNIVAQFEGSIDVKSKLNEGTTITVTVSLPIAENPADEPAAEQNDYRSRLAGKRILIAEDNPINMQIISTILTKNNIETVQAENGKEAYDIFCGHDENYFDAVLMDMQMPIMDGCSAAAAIRASGKNYAKTIPIIAVTANAFAEDLKYITESGMNSYLLKPLDTSLLWKTLYKFIFHPEHGNQNK